MRIKQLPPIIANQIAAGEVIERPASIVKELLENSLDAQANHINIEINYGGLNQIKVADDGIGIVAEDLPLAIAAYATSKITELADLYAITSMGFRGEALASIAAIARLSISSKTAEQEHGMKLEYSNPELLIPHPRNQGTTVEAEDIFYNAPVRKKFLKTERIEYQAIDLVVRRFALSAPAIAINLYHNGKQQLHLPAAVEQYSLLNRITRLMGKAFIDNAIYLEVKNADFTLQGYVSSESYQRSQNDKVWTYLNNRIVRDKIINHAIKKAYQDILYPGRYPACLLFISLNPADVDVNVHPTKHEIRFHQPRLIHDFITNQLQQVLQQPKLVSGYKLPDEAISAEVREPLADFSLISNKDNIHDNKQLIFLDQQHGLAFIKAKPYLLDLPGIQQAWLLNRLQQATLPLPNRPLLVPVHYYLPDGISCNELQQQLLKKAGIEIQKINEMTLLINSLPLLIANLDIKLFLTQFFASTVNCQTSLLTLLTKSQCISHDILKDQQQELLDYLQEVDLIMLASSGLLKHLSAQTCQDLLHAK